MADMDQLVQFLHARYAEEAEEAGKLDDIDDGDMEPWQVRRDETGTYDSYAYVRIAKARVLADVEAKQQVIIRYQTQATLLSNHMGGILTKYLVNELAAVVRLLALPYVDHPDYQDEWRP